MLAIFGAWYIHFLSFADRSDVLEYSGGHVAGPGFGAFEPESVGGNRRDIAGLGIYYGAGRDGLTCYP